MDKRTACIIGSTGLVGGHLLDLLLEDPVYEKIIVVNRRAKHTESEIKISEVIIEDFKDLKNNADELSAMDYFCCLGTTINKAGSKKKFREVDYQYIVDFAEIARTHHAKAFIVISAMGAKASSSIFYNKVKGETEDAIRQLKINATTIIRPSLITGERTEKRSGEATAKWLMTKLSFIFRGPLKKYGPVHAKQIAASMRHYAKNATEPFQVVESDKIQDF